MIADLIIGIGADYKGKPAFDAATNAANKLDKNIKVLTRSLGGYFALNALYNAGKASYKAFAQDDIAAKALTKTLDNLGLSFESASAASYLKTLENIYHVADDQLSPSFAKLLQVTGSYSMSQKILNSALDASAGSGIGLEESISTLSQAYVGNLKGLRKFNLGLTATELKTMSFQEVLDKVNKTFTGQGLLAANSQIGKMKALGVAVDNTKEKIGAGLVDAINTAFGNTDSVDGFAKSLDQVASGVNAITKGLGNVIAFLRVIPNSFNNGDVWKLGGSKTGKVDSAKFGADKSTLASLERTNDKNAQKRAKAEADAIKRNKELEKLAKAQVIAAANLAKLKSASKVMDIDQIQIQAALMGKVSEDEANRLKLQRAILDENGSAAEALAKKVFNANIGIVDLQGNIINDPFSQWSISLDAAASAARKLAASLPAGTSSVPGGLGTITPGQQESIISNIPMGGYNGPGGVGASGGSFYLGGTKVTVDLNLNGDLNQLISASVVGNTANGNSNSLVRNGSFSQMAS
jgi:hypothetical protein